MSTEPPDSGSPFWAVAVGLLAGAIWRAPRWFSKDGPHFQLPFAIYPRRADGDG